MKWTFWIIAAIVLMATAVGVCWFEFKTPAPASTDAGAPSASIAHVVLGAIEKKPLSESITAFGSVIAQPGKSRFMSAAFDTRARRILVAPGEGVSVGEPLVEIEPSPTVQLQLEESQATVDAAQRDLHQTQQKFDLRLATNQELGAAKKAAESAVLQLQSLKQQGVTSQSKVASEINGLVDKVDVQPGQIVQAGSPLVEIVAHDEIEAKLGVEPEEVRHLFVGQSVTLSQVHLEGAKPVQGKIRLLTERVNPDTRLVDVYVTLASGSQLLLYTYLRADLQTLSHDALIVPRSAVLMQNGAPTLFTVWDNHAVLHIVQLGIQTDKLTEIISTDLKAGDQVVTEGNYELTDGMAVTTGTQP